jgi:prepilin-type N-terminal cleavage/methylation domain-containing protein
MTRRQRGFTLIEMIVSILILGILGAAAAYGIQNGVIAFQTTSAALDTLSKLRVSTERVARELREIRRDPLDSGRYDITEPFAADQISFVKTDGTRVSLAVAGNTLTLEYDTPTGVFTLTDQLSSFSLAYYGSDGSTSVATADALAFIEVELVLSDTAGNSLPQQTRIALRSQP